MKIYKITYLITICLLLFTFNNIYATTNLNLTCKSHIAINADDEKVLFDNNAFEKVYPASTTKILTAIITIEKLNLDDKITITSEMMSQIPYDSSVMEIREGEIYTVKDLLYGLMLVSGNDVAIVFADTISGNMDSFANLMNEKLKEIGCNSTHFVNAHGYHDDNHYTTAYDMAILFNYCLKNKTFEEIINTMQANVSPINNPDRVLVLENSNYMLYGNSNVYCKEIKGGKTGFTYEALGTFIGYAKKDDMTIIIGSYGGMHDSDNLSARFSDTRKISNYIFDNFEKIELAKKGDFNFSFKDLTNKKIYSVALADDMSVVVPKNYVLNYTVDIENVLLYDNQNIGKIHIDFKNSNLSYTKNLYIVSSEDIPEDTSLTVIYLLIFIFILLVILKLKQLLISKIKFTYYKYKHTKLLDSSKNNS